MSKKLPAWIVLTVIALVAALALGATYNGTKDRIAAQEAEKAVAVRQELLPDAQAFEQVRLLERVDGISGATYTTEAILKAIEENFAKLEAQGAADGTAVSSAQGFAGPVAVEMTVKDGVISGIKIGDDQFAETEGFGAKALEADFAERFIGLGRDLSVDQTGDVEVWRGTAADGSAVGYVSTGTVTGFGGPVEVTVGTDAEGTIKGVRVGGANFSETAGLGAKAKEPKFYEQFSGKVYPVDLIKNGGEIDAITAATITSSAVVRGVNDTIKNMSAVAGFKVNEPVVLVTELGNNRYSTSKKGFAGPVYVELEVVDGAITDIVIGDDSFNESAGYGQKAKDESFYGQYIGKGGTQLTLGSDIDAISGATITSTAVNDAVNMILLYVNDPAAFAAQMADAGEEADVSIPEGAQTYTAEAQGLTGTFDVTIGVDENGAVNGIALGDASSDMDAAFLGMVKDNNAFLAQFIGATGNVNAADIDMVTGATISSQGTVEAVNKAYNKYLGIEEPTASAPAKEPAAGTAYDTTAQGLVDPINLTVTVDNGVITDVTVKDSNSATDAAFVKMIQTDANYLAQFVGKSEIDVNAVDIVSGATVSSKSIAQAVSDVLAKASMPAAAGTAYDTTAQGLVDPINLTVTVDNGVVTDVTVKDSNSATDAAFVKMIQNDANYLAQFVGKSEIDLNAVDIVSGATISSKSIAEAVSKVLAEAGTAPAEVPTVPAGTAYDTTAQGLVDPINLTVTVDNGVITDVTVKDSNSATDASFVKMIQNDANYLAQFAGKSEVDLNAVDMVSGATISSKSIAEAVSKVLAEAGEAPAEAPAGTAYDTTAQGLVDPINLTVTVDNGVITDVTVKDSNSATDAAFVKMIQSDANYLAQFVGKSEIDVNAVDVVSGATISSKSIAEAVSKVLAEAGAAPVEAPAAPAGTAYDTTAQGLVDPIDLTVTVDNGVITDVTVKDSNSATDAAFVKMIQNDANYLAQFVGKSEIDLNAVDIVSGATISSKSIAEAVSKVLAEAGAAPAEAPAAPAGTAYDTTAQGLVDPIDLTVTVDNGVITGVTVKDSNSATDASFVKMIQNDANYLAQFVGKSEIDVNAVDMVSGATISSKSIAEAVSQVLAETVPVAAQ